MKTAMIQVNKVSDLVDRMMRVNIFPSSEKLRMSRDEEKTFLDPNLIMDARHRILREDLSVSPTKRSVLAEARRLLTQEEARQLYAKKQQRFLERELTKFEMELHKSRTKLFKPYTCKKRSFAPSDDESFWGTSRRIKHKTTFAEKTERKCSSREKAANTFQKKSAKLTEIDDSKAEDRKEPEKIEGEISCVGSIKVTIKDKSNFESETQRLRLLRKCFDTLKQNVEKERRLRNIKTKIQQRVTFRITKKYFDIWRASTKYAKNNAQIQKKEQELFEEQRIEQFINVITERQKVLTKNEKPKVRDGNLVKESSNVEIKRNNVYSKPIVVESPAQSRLDAQKRIIGKQRAKLTEQNQIIEELKLKQAQTEISRATTDTVDMAKKTLAHCGQNTRRTVIRLMQRAGYSDSMCPYERDENLTVSQRSSNPPKFLLRMEARAEARRERIKLAEESRRRKLMEQERKEEAARVEEEQKKRRLQREVLTQARRLRKQQELNRQREIETFNELNSMADEFYRKYLLRHYIIEPLIALIEQKKSNIKKAKNHCRAHLTRKVFIAWKGETETRCKILTETAESFYNRYLTVRMFGKWKQISKEVNLKYQVAIDFYDMKLLGRYCKLWQTITLVLKAQYERKAKLASNRYENKLKVRYFCRWKKYLTIAANVTESDERKDKLRQLVQTVIPDFDPKQRGVALED